MLNTLKISLLSELISLKMQPFTGKKTNNLAFFVIE